MDIFNMLGGMGQAQQTVGNQVGTNANQTSAALEAALPLLLGAVLVLVSLPETDNRPKQRAQQARWQRPRPVQPRPSARYARRPKDLGPLVWRSASLRRQCSQQARWY